jgi:hypothetical protein
MVPVSSLPRSEEPKTGPLRDRMNPFHIFIHSNIFPKRSRKLFNYSLTF